MRLLKTWLGPSGDVSVEKLLDLQIAHLWRLVEQLQTEKADLRREATYWKDKFMTLMGVGDMSYPMMGAAQEVAKDEEQEPTHVSLIGLRARHELEAKQKAREIEREKKA